jgi:hypothetical protein
LVVCVAKCSFSFVIFCGVTDLIIKWLWCMSFLGTRRAAYPL